MPYDRLNGFNIYWHAQSHTYSISKKVNGQRVVLAVAWNGSANDCHGNPSSNYWGVCLMVGATRKQKKLVRTDQTWRLSDSHFERSTGRSGLRCLMAAKNMLLAITEQIRKDWGPGEVIHVRGQDKKRLDAYAWLKRYGFTESAYWQHAGDHSPRELKHSWCIVC